MQVNLCYLFVYILEALIFYYYCSNLFEQRRTKKQIFLTIGFAYFIEYLMSLFYQSIINASLFVVFNFLMLIILYKNKLVNAFFHTIILTIAMGGTELLIAPIFTSNFWAEQSLFHNLIIQAPLCKLAYFTVINLIIRIFRGIRSENKYTSTANFVLTIISILTFIILYSLLALFTQLPLDIMQRLLIVANAVIILVINLLSSWIYSFTLKKSEESARLEFQLQKEQDYCQYYQALLKEDEQQRILIHDIKKHLQSIMALNEEQDTEHIASYIKHLLSDYELQTPIQISDNKLLNSICNRYRTLCQKHSISFHADIRKHCLLSLPENELTTIVCNLLDNAAEATINIPNSFVEINIYKRQNFTYINVINTCLVNPFDTKSGKLISRKKVYLQSGILHGLGLKSVEQIAERHQGAMECHYDKEMHEFHVTLSLCDFTPS